MLLNDKMIRTPENFLTS